MSVSLNARTFFAMTVWMLLGGYLVFHARQHSYDEATKRAAAANVTHDNTVVLTGGPGRIYGGLALLRSGRTSHVFVSGVWEGYKKSNLPAIDGLEETQLDCCVTLGFDALDTAGNGEESARWLAKRGAQDVFLVTSHYHMPRAMVELTRWAPSIKITPISVGQGRSMARQIAEYVKYGAALARLRLSPPKTLPKTASKVLD